MTSDHHRLLVGLDPESPGTGRVWILRGTHLQDVFFHDLFHGCVSLRRTLELWGLSWAASPGDDPTITVTLTATGNLDFEGNPDPDAAREQFDRMRDQRPARYGHRRTPAAARVAGGGGEVPAGDGAAQGEDAEDDSAAQQAAASVAGAVGTGRGLLNRMAQLSAALRRPGAGRLVVIVEDLAGQLHELTLRQDEAAAFAAGQILRNEWIPTIDQTRCLLVLIDLSDDLHTVVPAGAPGVVRREIGPPDEREITEALQRVARRRGLRTRDLPAVAAALTGRDDLRGVLGRVARVHRRGLPVELASVLDLPPIDEQTVARTLVELDRLVGLDDLKAKARELVASARKRRQRLQTDGSFEVECLHMVFTGPPGTGKTTVAEIIAKLFHALGLLRTDRVVTRIASQIMSEYVGATRTAMQQVLDDADGGVLFIDELQHFADRRDSKAVEAVQALVPTAWNRRSSMVIILAGYDNDLPSFLEMDPGLPRRFPPAGRLAFAPLGHDELWQVVTARLAAARMVIAEDAQEPARRLLEERRRRAGFGNAGGAENLADELLARHDSAPDAVPGVVSVGDLPPVVVTRADVVEQASRALDRMIGLDGVRAELDAIRFDMEWAVRENEFPAPLSGMVLSGPPGTGKTTVARLLSKLLYGYGAIAQRKTIEVPGPMLRQGFVGQTAHYVATLFRQARDGVLFIDEAYGIQTSDRDDFGADAVNALIHQMTAEENQGTVVIFAGYRHELDRFLQLNSGLTRRFQCRIEFPHFTPADCVEVVERALARQSLRPGPGVAEAFARRAEQAQLAMGDSFGNAAWAEGAVTAAVRQLRIRVRDGDLVGTDASVLRIEDVRAVGGT